MKTIKVYDITGCRAVMDTPDGDIVYKQIQEEFEKGEDVTLDFENVDTILSIFLNSAIAPLYSEYDGEYLKEHLIIKNMSDDDKLTLKRVNSRAKQFYKEKKEEGKYNMEDIYG